MGDGCMQNRCSYNCGQTAADKDVVTIDIIGARRRPIQRYLRRPATAYGSATLQYISSETDRRQRTDSKGSTMKLKLS